MTPCLLKKHNKNYKKIQNLKMDQKIIFQNIHLYFFGKKYKLKD